jgi:hypothetical protein
MLGSALLNGCIGFREINRSTSPDVRYVDFRNSNREIRFVDMTWIGKKRFFENAGKLTSIAKRDGYALYYEHIDFSGSSDTILRKIRRINGFVPDTRGYESMFRTAVNNGFVVYDSKKFLTMVNDKDRHADVTPESIVKEYENKYGPVRLSSRDYHGDPYQPVLRWVHTRRINSVMFDYRSSILANTVHAATDDRMIILYSAKHRRPFFKTLQALDSTWVKVGTYTTRRDDRFDHTLAPDTARQLIQDGWIERMGSKIGVRLSFDNDIESFSVDTEDLDFEIEPNTSVRAKVSAHYRFITVSYSYSPRLFPGNDDDEIKGNTESFGLGLNLSFRHWFQGMAYQKTKGYYISNTDELDPQWQPGDPYFQSPELVYQSIQGVTGYSFNPKFSVASLTSQTERQLKSAGSFTPQIHYRYYVMDDRKELTPLSSSQRSDNLEAVLAGGYHHTFVIRDSWYLNAGGEMGAGYLYTRLETRGVQTGTSNQDNFVFRWDARSGIGYNGRRFFMGGLATATGSSFRQENTTAVNVDTRIYCQVFAGYRLTAPRFLRKRFE